MKSEKARELQQLIERAEKSDGNPFSDDLEVAKKAEAQLGATKKDLESWATRHGVKLIPYSTGGRFGGRLTGFIDKLRKPCAPTYKPPTTPNGPYMCILIGRDGRNCLYSCVDFSDYGDPTL